MLEILKNEYADHIVKDIKTNPKTAKLDFIITYLIVSKIIISSLKFKNYKNHFFIKNSSSLIFL